MARDKKPQLAASLPSNKASEAARLKNKVDEYKSSPAAGTSKLTNTKNVVKKRNEIADTLLRQKNRKSNKGSLTNEQRGEQPWQPGKRRRR